MFCKHIITGQKYKILRIKKINLKKSIVYMIILFTFAPAIGEVGERLKPTVC